MATDAPKEQQTVTEKPAKLSTKKTDDLKKEPLSADAIHVKLFSPFQVYYNAEAKSISAVNDTGPFDVLPKHHSFITLLNPCEIDITAPDNSVKRIRISQGVMHVRDNKVTVFLDV